MASTHPIANSDRSRAHKKASAAEAAAWLSNPTTPTQEFSYANYLANQPPWTGPDPTPEDE